MTAGDLPAMVTICKGWHQGLYADDYGVTVRPFLGPERRFAWAEVSRFADGSRTGDSTDWILLIVLRTGETFDVGCTLAKPTPDILDTVRQVAARYGIPADLTGIPTEKDGPAERGLYEDPAGLAGLRYWDGRQWSPLVPLNIGQSEAVRKSAGSWSSLPAADGSWTYAAARARSWTVTSAVTALVSAGFLTGLYYAHGRIGASIGFGGFAAMYVLMSVGSWRERKFFLKLNEATKKSPGN